MLLISYLKIIEPNSVSVWAKCVHVSNNIKREEIGAGWLPHTLQEGRIHQWNELNIFYSVGNARHEYSMHTGKSVFTSHCFLNGK